MLNRSINASYFLAAWQNIGTVSAAYRGRHSNVLLLPKRGASGFFVGTDE